MAVVSTNLLRINDYCARKVGWILPIGVIFGSTKTKKPFKAIVFYITNAQK